MTSKTTAWSLVVSFFSIVKAGAQTVSYEANVFPDEVGWEHTFHLYQAERWIEDGRLFQRCELATKVPPWEWEQDGYNYYMTALAGTQKWFMDWSNQTDAPPVWGAVAPCSIVAHGFTGVVYHFTMGNNEVRLIRGFEFPIIYAPLEIGVDHHYHLELDNTGVLPTYAFYRDGELIDSGEGEGVYPTTDSRITFNGRAAVQPALTQWQYIRFGSIPSAASADYDSDNLITNEDWFFTADCIIIFGPGIFGGPRRACPDGDETCVKVACQNDADCTTPMTTTGPGCTFADMDSDGDVDLLDVAVIFNLFDGSVLPNP